jgi:hypothetical protein
MEKYNRTDLVISLLKVGFHPMHLNLRGKKN